MSEFKLTIDNHLCWGCKTCEVACKQENRAADGVKFIGVKDIGPGLVDGKLEFTFLVNLCRHCDDPPCAQACPEGAIVEREDGIVVMDDVVLHEDPVGGGAAEAGVDADPLIPHADDRHLGVGAGPRLRRRGVRGG